MSQPKISVIIPIYNVSKFLDQCLKSIANQTYQNLEIICLNDGSTDNSLDIINSWASKDSRFVVVDKANEGYGTTCNRGIAAATGDYLSIIEPDDYIAPTMYEEMITFAQSFSEKIDVIKTPWFDVENWDKPETTTIKPSLMHKALKTSKKPFTLEENSVLIEKHPSVWSALYRMDFLKENSINFREYPGAGWADNPFLIDTLVLAKTIIYLDKPFYYYRLELPGANKNHATPEGVMLPFNRWLDMTEQLKTYHVTSQKIWNSHYLRGFNYVYGAIRDDGWDNPLVQKGAKEIFSFMDPELVFSNPVISPARKQLFIEVTGCPQCKLPKGGYYAHLLDETLHRIKARGIGDAALAIKVFIGK